MRSFEIRDPQDLICAVADRVDLTEDTAYVVLVHQPSTAQRIVSITRLRTPALIDHYEEARDELFEVMQRLPLPDVRPPEHAVVTVLVRPGLCVLGPNESCWFLAWRYSNHLMSCYDSDLVLVTEHGWRDAVTELGGWSPSMVA